MRPPQDLPQAALIEIVAAVQQRLYLDVEQGQFFWNPHKEWSCADAMAELANLLADHGLASEVQLPFTP